jgi:hypothetical protein
MERVARDFKELQAENAELEKDYYEMVDKANSLEWELECAEREIDRLMEMRE